MADNKSTLWYQTHIIDMFARAKHPLAHIGALIVFLLFVEILLTVALAPYRSERDFELNDPSDVSRLLTLAVNDTGVPWLLVGDSVLAGDVMAGHVDDWRKRRIIDYLNSEKAADANDSFYQVALNGLLPVDANRVLAELDRTDPTGKVGLILELNMRYFSRHYAEQNLCTRSWLNDVAPRVYRDGKLDHLEWTKLQFGQGCQWLADHVPVLRHREFFPFDVNIAHNTDLARPLQTDSPNELAGRIRIQEHYKDTVLTADNAQVKALTEMIARLRATNRKAVFFITPLNDKFLKEAMNEQAYGDNVAALAAITDVPQVSVVNLDHPLFVRDHFVDHCHMLPEGNRLLALNLLHEMNIGLTYTPDISEIVHAEGADVSLVWNTGTGYCDGPAWLAAFDTPTGIAVDSTNKIIVADTGNHCLRAITGSMQTVRTIAGQPGVSGNTDGKSIEALLDSPRDVAIGENGDTYFVDGQGSQLRRLDQHGIQTEHVESGEQWDHIQTIRIHTQSSHRV